MKQKKYLFTALMLILIFLSYGCSKNKAKPEEYSTKQQGKTVQGESTNMAEKPKVTFVELGSVGCIPCKMMQPVMKAVEEEFGNQIKVVFYDVWKDNAPAKKYGIKLIPTQVFLDKSGKEFFRHEGYFPKAEIEKLLVEKGLKLKSTSKVDSNL